jgi:hypothetical protein
MEALGSASVQLRALSRQNAERTCQTVCWALLEAADALHLCVLAARIWTL